MTRLRSITTPSSVTCDSLAWRRPDGRRKDVSTRVALVPMERDRLIALPPPRNGNGNIARHQAPPGLQLPFTAPSTLEALGDIELVVVRPRPPPVAPERSLPPKGYPSERTVPHQEADLQGRSA